jgi:tRNA(Ile)-lysidine synthase
MLAASMDRVPSASWDGWEMRRHRGWLYCEQKLPALDTQQVLEWPTHMPLQLPAGLGSLRISPGQPGRLSAAKLPATLTVRFRAGGETLQPAGHAIHHKLKKLLQASAVLPWWRERLPLIYAGKQLVAVGDLWIAAEFAAREREPAVSIVWEPHPTLVGRHPNV